MPIIFKIYDLFFSNILERGSGGVNVCFILCISHLTFLCSCHKRFAYLDPEAVKVNKNAKLPMRTIMTLDELKVRILFLLFLADETFEIS